MEIYIGPNQPYSFIELVFFCLCDLVIHVKDIIHRLRMVMKWSLCGPVICVTDMIHRLRLDAEVESIWCCRMRNKYDPQIENDDEVESMWPCYKRN